MWISRAIVEDLPIDRPLWKIVVHEDYMKCDDGSGDFLSCVLLRAHHVIADGVGVVSMLDTLMVSESEVETEISAHEGMRKASVVNKQEPENVLMTYLRIAMFTLPVMGKILKSAIDVNPFKTRHVEGRKVVGMLNDTIDLERVKVVRTAMGDAANEKYTVNDLLMGVLGCALNRT
ncbi:hypothetical protein SARC_04735 [Sphaeroforma arctica JP610]|uniref:Diacylglycerol O-acyltransferase n=1 Tax=Sphaeroforma arctica JP610 TaxID=667725 RepID=A0A0L0G1H0_9EUKA|nr:hypothetical protein SARC_04735 [Sphaeroforma arctica JP610]KNC82987.1 hypothetical protein SARC_04735 [Sphaeroforma arctica JP610]|eukprot:XP_014156889.1 hypothetical protein SARC_04735 [Sphaeroforma arctica JP610]